MGADWGDPPTPKAGTAGATSPRLRGKNLPSHQLGGCPGAGALGAAGAADASTKVGAGGYWSRWVIL